MKLAVHRYLSGRRPLWVLAFVLAGCSTESGDGVPRCLGLAEGECASLSSAVCSEVPGCSLEGIACSGQLDACLDLALDSCELQVGCWIGCDYPQHYCDGGCVDLASNSENCGACGVLCAEGEACSEGQCECTEPYHPDRCGSCNLTVEEDCLQDCEGAWGGSARMDECGVCDEWPINDCVEDCAGIWGGSAILDDCGTCDSDPSNDCVAGCATHQEQGACWVLANDFQNCLDACGNTDLEYSDLTANHTGGMDGQAACFSILATFGHTVPGSWGDCINPAQAGCGVLTSTGETCYEADATVQGGVGAFGYRRLCACVEGSP